MSKEPRQRPGRSRQDYATPPALITAACDWLGIDGFDFDYACGRSNIKAPYGWTVEIDALAQSPHDWARVVAAGWGWLNPPFARIGPWAARSLEAMHEGAHLMMLVPASVGSNWYRLLVDGRDNVEVLFLNPRISFDGVAPFPKDCMIVRYGTDAEFRTSVWRWLPATTVTDAS